jgi:hypothetical protein
MTMMMTTIQVAAASRRVLVMMMAASALLMVATSSSPVETAADPSVTVRLIVNSGRTIDPSICTDADWNILIHAAASVGGNNKKSALASSSSSSPSWCQVYCAEFGRSSCWLANPACHGDSELIVEDDRHTATMIGMLSEMELLLPDIHDDENEAQPFTPAMRATCFAQRAVALQAVNNVMEDELSLPCRRALQQRRIIADCVMLPRTEEGVALVK